MAEPAAAADRAAGKHGAVRVRRAMIIMASASGTLVSAIARLVAASGDMARDVIDAFNQKGLAALGPRWAGGRPRLISDGDIEMIVAAGQDPAGEAGACRSRTGACAGLAGYLAPGPAGADRPGAVAADLACPRNQLPADPGLEEPADPDQEAKLDRIEYVASHYPDRCFGSGRFGPLPIRPCHGPAWVRPKNPWCAPVRASSARFHRAARDHGGMTAAMDIVDPFRARPGTGVPSGGRPS
jgi:hypothetical protein